MRCPDSQLPRTQDDSKPPQCCLCPIEGGALKPTTEPGLWCHATCLQWIPEVSVGDDRRMEPVTHIRSIQKERWELNCCICKSVTSLLHVAPAAHVSVWWSQQLCSMRTHEPKHLPFHDYAHLQCSATACLSSARQLTQATTAPIRALILLPPSEALT